VPAFPDVGEECITLYGDSFTYGSQVEDEEAWGNLLAVENGCRVGNFGVPGYGTDQALLRFLANSADTAPVSLLGITPHDIRRNVTQYFYLQAPGRRLKLSFKPRFVLEENELRLIPLPNPSYSDLQNLDKRFDDLLPYEEFRPGGNIGPVVKRFPYTLTLFNLLMHHRVQDWLLGRPSWVDFLDEDGPTNALQVAVGIISRFDEECHIRSKKCAVLFFPTPSSYSAYVEDGLIAMSTIFKRLDELGIPYLNLTPLIAQKLGQRNYCEVLANPEPCTGHPNAEGNRIIANIVVDYIRQNNIL